MLHECQTTTIRGNHRQFSFTEAHQHALERLARIILRGGIGRLAKHFTQCHLRNHILKGILVLGERRKVYNRHTVKLEFSRTSGNEGTVRRADIHLNRPFRRLGDSIDQKLDGECGGSLFKDLAAHVRTDGDIEISRGEKQILLLRLKQNILDDQHRSLGTDNVLNLLQSFKKL